MFGVEPVEPNGLIAAVEVGPGFLGKIDNPIEMPVSGFGKVSGFHESVDHELFDKLQHSISLGIRIELDEG